jgi:hypothetical protein
MTDDRCNEDIKKELGKTQNNIIINHFKEIPRTFGKNA